MYLQVKTWFQNRRMKHKKQLRKVNDDTTIVGTGKPLMDNTDDKSLNKGAGDLSVSCHKFHGKCSVKMYYL